MANKDGDHIGLRLFFMRIVHIGIQNAGFT